MLKIKKRVSLEFLGEDYNESYVDVYSVPMKDLKVFESDMESLKKTNDTGKSLDYMTSKVLDHLVGGKISQDGKLVDITKDNIEDLPSEVFLEIWQQMAGGAVPKAS